MARIKGEDSTRSFKGFGLEPHEDKELIATMKRKDTTGQKLVRMLLREWIKENRIR